MKLIRENINIPTIPDDAHLRYVLHLTSPLSETSSAYIVFLTSLVSFLAFYKFINSVVLPSAICLFKFLRASDISPVNPIIFSLSSTNF